MRITKSEAEIIKKVLVSFIHSNDFLEVFLYGSRVDDELKGGDIDLICLVSQDIEEKLNLDKYKILAKLKNELGDQKIDLGIMSSKTIKSNVFYQDILKKAIKL